MQLTNSYIENFLPNPHPFLKLATVNLRLLKVAGLAAAEALAEELPAAAPIVLLPDNAEEVGALELPLVALPEEALAEELEELPAAAAIVLFPENAAIVELPLVALPEEALAEELEELPAAAAAIVLLLDNAAVELPDEALAEELPAAAAVFVRLPAAAAAEKVPFVALPEEAAANELFPVPFEEFEEPEDALAVLLLR